jgi:AhpC/TSA family
MKWKLVILLIFIVPIALVVGGYAKTGESSEKPKMFEELVPVGAQASDFTLETLEGATVSLRSLNGKIVILVTGARTCPAFLIWANPMDELYKAYQGRDDVKFLYLYTREPYAGAIPGYGWSYRDDRQPESYEERKQYASAIRDEHEIDIPIMIDTMDGAVQKAYGNMPNSVVIIDRDGKIAARDRWNDPLLVELALRDMVNNPPEVKQVETMLSCGQCHEDRVNTIDENPEFNCGTCHSFKKARKGLKGRMDRSHRKTSCDTRCHNMNNKPLRFDQPGQTGTMRDLFIGTSPLYEEPGLAFTHLPHMNSGRFAYQVNFLPVSYKTKIGSCIICHKNLEVEKCTKCHGSNPHEFHEVFADEMGCLGCHTTPGKVKND